MLALYRLATELAGWWIDRHLEARARRGKELPDRIGERRGIAGRPRPDGPLLWVHAASVGESVAALVLIERLAQDRPSLTLLLTSGTVTSANLVASRLPANAIHQFVPVDQASGVRRFLDHWRPDAAVWLESELWPNLVTETRRRNVPMVLANARISARSYRRWRRLPFIAGPVLRAFDHCLALDEEQATRLRKLGAPGVRVVGNLKASAAALSADQSALAGLQKCIGDRLVWVASSLHPGEEPLVAAVQKRFAGSDDAPLAILVPRHPENGPPMATAMADAGLTVRLRSHGDRPDGTTDVYVADTLGEMGLWFRLAGLAFVGGSLVSAGGHNPLEPAHFGVAIVHGPDMANNRELAGMLARGGGAEPAETLASAAELILALLKDGPRRRQQGTAAREIVEAERGALEAVTDVLAAYLDPIAPPIDKAPGDART